MAVAAIPPGCDQDACHSRPHVTSNAAAAPTDGCADVIDPDPVSGS